MFWVRQIVLFLLLVGIARAQTSPGFIDSAVLCANYPNPACQGQPPTNPMSLNQAFMGKADYPLNFTVPQSIITPLHLPTTDGATFLVQDGPTTAFQIYGLDAPAGTNIFGNIRSVITANAGFDVQNFNAYDAFMVNSVAWNASSVPHAHATVGMEIFGRNNTIGAATFAVNLAVFDTYMGVSYPSYLLGGELDFDMQNTGSVVTGFSFVLNGVLGDPTNCHNIFQKFCGGAAMLEGFAVGAAKWNVGMAMSDGSMAPGGFAILAGTEGVAPKPCGIPSDPCPTNVLSSSIGMNIIDMAGIEQRVHFQAQPGLSGAPTARLRISQDNDTAPPNFPNGLLVSFEQTTTSPPANPGPIVVFEGMNGFIYGSNLPGGMLSLRSTLDSTTGSHGDVVQITVNNTMGMAAEVARFDFGGPIFPIIRTAGGTGSSSVCIDNAGLLFKKTGAC